MIDEDSIDIANRRTTSFYNNRHNTGVIVYTWRREWITFSVVFELCGLSSRVPRDTSVQVRLNLNLRFNSRVNSILDPFRPLSNVDLASEELDNLTGITWSANSGPPAPRAGMLPMLYGSLTSIRINRYQARSSSMGNNYSDCLLDKALALGRRQSFTRFKSFLHSNKSLLETVRRDLDNTY